MILRVSSNQSDSMILQEKPYMRPHHLLKYRVLGWGCRAEPTQELLSAALPQGSALSPFPLPCSHAGLWHHSHSAVCLAHRQKSRLTCLLSLASSYSLEKRPFCCAANLRETRAIQCKRLGNLSFDTRPVRFACMLA